jgi:hypothetical protein
MKIRSVCLPRVLLTTVAVGPSAIAQTPPPSAPGPGAARRAVNPFGGPTLRSPEVSADRSVTFRLSATNAREVFVRGITRQPLTMQKDSQGIWTATTEPLQPDIYA